MGYSEFLARKRRVWTGIGSENAECAMSPVLYAWQRAIVRWALRKGRAAIFADCGLGKTFMQVAWANALGVRTIIVAPLCVAEQTVLEATKLGVSIRYARNDHEAHGAPIVITNYERIDDFTMSAYDAAVLDESSILKAFDGRTRTRLIEMFRDTRYRLCCTATPSPNDITELANHAEFLGLMTRPEFLATWFVRIQEGHRTTDHHGWRMKRHAVEPFYRWLSSWAVAVRTPSDIGYDDAGFDLPPLAIRECVTDMDAPWAHGALFPEAGLKGLSGRLAARRGSLGARVSATADLVEAEPTHQWLVWCGLNEESTALTKEIHGSVEVRGDDSYADKVGAVTGFISGDIRVLVSKPKILGFGMNFQNCARMAFVGLSDSYEAYYQAIRRCWRYGQKCPVDAWLVVSEPERLVVENVRRKELKARTLSDQLLNHMREFERQEVKHT